MAIPPILLFAPPPTQPIVDPSPGTATVTAAGDFSDRESQRVLTAAAHAVAHELGREAAREYFAELIGTPKAS